MASIDTELHCAFRKSGIATLTNALADTLAKLGVRNVKLLKVIAKEPAQNMMRDMELTWLECVGLKGFAEVNGTTTAPSEIESSKHNGTTGTRSGDAR